MIKSSKPKKQRYFRFNAPMHIRQHFVHAHLDKELRERLGLKRKAVQISKGDTVKIMSGSKKGTSGGVTKVDLRTGRIYIDSLTRKNAKGKEHGIGISASNVSITALKLDDKVRAAKLKIAPIKAEKAKVVKNAALAEGLESSPKETAKRPEDSAPKKDIVAEQG